MSGPVSARAERDQERRLRAWQLRGQPEPARREKPPGPREASVLAAHRAGVLVLGGDFAAEMRAA